MKPLAYLACLLTGLWLTATFIDAKAKTDAVAFTRNDLESARTREAQLRQELLLAQDDIVALRLLQVEAHVWWAEERTRLIRVHAEREARLLARVELYMATR